MNVVETPHVQTTGFLPKTHISLNVRDVETSVRFYEAFFGVSVHKRRPGYANFDIAAPALKLALNEHVPTGEGESRLNHLGIQLATVQEVAAARQRLEATGLVSFNEGDTVCCYARQNKVWVTDPDGNSWEVYVLLDEMDDEEDEHFEAGHAKDVPHRNPLAMAGVCCGRGQSC